MAIKRNGGEVDSWYCGREILVPGGAGFIGGALVRQLCRAGAKVTIVDAIEPGCGGDWSRLDDLDFAPESNLRCIEARLAPFLENESLEHYSVIFNCIGLTDHFIGQREPKRDYEINCASVLGLLMRLRQEKLRCRLISIGSRNQYGQSPNSEALSESTPLAPLDVQSIHKGCLEHYHQVFSRGAAFETVFLRLTNTYGPGQRLNGPGVGFVGELLRAALNNEEVTIYGSLDRAKDLVFVEDVADALMRVGCSERPASVFNLGGKAVSLERLLKAIEAETAPLNVKIRPFPDHVRQLDTGDTRLDSSALTSLCGWQPTTPIEKGVALTLKARRNRFSDALVGGLEGW